MESPTLRKTTLRESSKEFYSAVMPSQAERKHLEKTYAKIFDISNVP